MKKKGFTLVELLAVIVILAVIALIAVPLVLNMIEKGRIGSAEDSAYSYVKGIEDSIVTGYLSGNELNAGDYNVGDIKVNIKGSTPTNGSYELDSKNEVISGKFCINGYSIDYDGKYATYNKDVNYCNGNIELNRDLSANKVYENGETVYFNPTTGEKCDSSSAVSITETKTGCMKWYTFLDEGANSDKVNMILDHNTTSKIKWNDSGKKVAYESSNLKAEIDALVSTNGWKVQPRIITADEIAKITGANLTGFNTSQTEIDWFCLDTNEQDTVNNCAKAYGTSNYAWLFDYTKDCKNYGCNVEDKNTYGYWTSSLHGSRSTIWLVYNYGFMGNRNSDAYFYGIRPVIEVSKIDIK